MRRLQPILLRLRKHYLKSLGLAVLYALPLLTIPATGAIFLKIEGIEGGSVDKDHEKWIDAQSLFFGVSRPVGAPTTVSEITISKPADAATPGLFLEAAQGKSRDVDLELVRTGEVRERYYRLKLYDVLVTAFSQSSGGDAPQETIALNYLKMEMTYTEFVKGSPGPETTAWYDVASGKGGVLPGNNTAPTISSIAQTNTAEETAVTLPFTIGDAQTAAANLSLSRSSGNTGLLPLANIAFGGSGANRTVTLLPASNQTGTVNVTITVSDGQLSASTSFTLEVTPVNDPPQITTLNAQSTAVDVPITVGFSVSDPDNAAVSLQLSATSSSTALVPAGNLVFGGSGTDRTLFIKPALGQTGQCTIAIRAFDGSLATTNSFLLTVTSQATNQPPSFTVSNATVIPTIAGRFISITRLQLSDPDAGTNAVSLALQVVNGTLTINEWTGAITGQGTSNVVLSGSTAALSSLLLNTNGVRYRAHSGLAGTDVLTATINDNGHSGSGGAQVAFVTLGIRIYASQYDEWLHQQFTQAELDNPALESSLWGFHADWDRDRLENIAEYGLGTAPRGTNHPRPTAEFSVQGNQRFLTLQFNRRKDPDLGLTAEVAGDVSGPWSSDTAQLQADAPLDLGNGFEQMKFTDRTATTNAAQRYLRIRWSLAPALPAAPPRSATQR